MDPGVVEENAQAIGANPIKLDTKIPHLNERFFFHSIIKQSKFSNHYIAEDLQAEPTASGVVTFYFFKQNKYSNQLEYQHALAYYQKLLGYCKQPLSKNDIIKLQALFPFEDPASNSFELNTQFDYGEADRIEIDLIQVHQITRFLKNVCLLLQDLKKKTDLYHGNIAIKNIVLADGELKISGFKPMFLQNPEFQNWKTDLVKRTSHYRFDLYMIGLIWLRFLGSKIGEIPAENMSFDDFNNEISKRYQGLPDDKKTTIVESLLDINNKPSLDLDEAILLFDEYFILETHRANEIQNSRNSSSNDTEALNRNSTSDANRNSLLNLSEANPNNNLFTRNLNESGIDNMTFKEDPNIKVEDEAQKHDNDFTIRDDHTFVQPENMNTHDTHNSLIVVNDKRKSENSPTDKKNPLAATSSERKIAENNVPDMSIGTFRNDESYGSLPKDVVMQNQLEANEKRNAEQHLAEAETKPEDKPIEQNGVEGDKEKVQSFAKKDKPVVAEVVDKNKPKDRTSVAKPKADAPTPSDARKSSKEPAPAKKPSVAQAPKPKTSTASTTAPKDKKGSVVQPKTSTAKKPEAPKQETQKQESVKSLKEPTDPVNQEVENGVTAHPENHTPTEVGQSNEENHEAKKEDSPLENEQTDSKKDLSDTLMKEELPKDVNEVPNKEELNDEINAIADGSNLQNLEKKDSLDSKKDEASNTINIPKKSEKGEAEADAKSKTKDKKNGKLNAREKLDLMNQKLKLQSLPLNYFDYDRNINLALKKTMMDEVKKVELTPEQKEKIRKQIEDEKKKKLDDMRRKEDERKASMEKKYQSRQKENEALKQKIETILEKKIMDKTAKPKEIPVEHEPEHEKFVKTNKVEDTRPFNATTESLPILNNDQARRFKSKKQPKVADYKSEKERQDMFTFNHELENKNIPFKKVAWNPEHYMKGSRSPSPNATQNFCELKQNVFAKNFDKTVASDYYNSYKVQGSPPPKGENEKESNLPRTLDIITNEDFKKGKFDGGKLKFDARNMPVVSELENHFKKEPRNEELVMMENQLDDMLLNDDEETAKDHYDQNKRESLSPKMRFEYIKRMINHSAQKGHKPDMRKWLVELYELVKDTPEVSHGSLPQELAFNLAEFELENGNGDNAIKLLKSSDFDQDSLDVNRYERILAMACTKEGKEDDLIQYFNDQIDHSVGDSFKHLDITKLFVNISRTIEIINSTGDYKKMVKFCNKIMGILKQIKKMNQSLELKEHDYENLVECFLLNTLRFANKSKNYNLTNFLIGETIKNKEIDYSKNMNEAERKELIGFILDFCWHLKDLTDYGTYKTNYINYLNYAKDINKQCDLKPDNLKTSLTINFNRAVFHMKEENYKKSEALFDKCLTTYYAFFKDEAGQDFFNVLYNLGKALFNKEKYNECLYFFTRICEDQCKLDNLKEKSLKKLSVSYFMLGNHKKANEIIHDYLMNNMETRIPKRFYSYLSQYFVSAEKEDKDDFAQFFKKLSELPVNSLDSELYCYFKTYKALQKLYDEHHNYKENKRYLNVLEEISNDKKNPKENAQKLINISASIFNEIVNKQPIKGENAVSKLANLFYDDYMTVEENALNLAKFLNNALWTFLHLLPLFNERTFNQKHRQELFKKVMAVTPIEFIRGELYSMIKEIGLNKQKEAENYFTESNDKKGDEGETNKMGKLPSEQVLKNPEKDSNDFVLETEFKENKKLQKYVSDFLKQVKNMLFLDVIENVLTYYLRFEKTLIDLGLNYQKYNFIKQLIKFHLARDPKKEIDRTVFVGLLDQLFSKYNLCKQDLKILLILLEAFKDINYLKLFAIYLDKFHPSYSEIVFKELFFDQFMRKSEAVTKKFYEQIFSTRFYELENCYFMHYLESENFISIDKKFSFKLFLRNRHDLMNDHEFRDFFAKYIGAENLVLFDLKSHIYNAIIKLHKDEHHQPKEIWSEFQKQFLDSMTKLDSDRNKMFVLIFEILVLCNMIKDDPDQDAPKVFINVMDFCVKKFNFDLNFQYSRVLSLMGNIFFKFKYYKECIDVKNKALNLMSDDHKIDFVQPTFMPNVTKEQHFFHILSFLVVANIEEHNIGNSVAICDKIDKWVTNDAAIKFNRLILRTLVNLYQKKTSEPLKNVYEAISIFGTMSLTPFLNKMYQAILDKITLMVIERSVTGEEVQVVQRKSRSSITKLYDFKLDD